MFDTVLLTTVDEALEAAAGFETIALASNEAFDASISAAEAERCLQRALKLEAAT